MEETANLKLPYILPSQAQKHVTHNEALAVLDAVVQLSVLDRDYTWPLDGAAEGDRYLVPADGGGPWEGRGGEIAVYRDGGWTYFQPQRGWIAWVSDERQLYAFDGTSWAQTGGSANPTSHVGINATADDWNRLNVRSPAALFDAEGTDHRLVINKPESGGTGTILFQFGYSGRAEFGLSGSEDFSIKVSPDGSTWIEAMTIDRNSGVVRFPAGIHSSGRRRPGRPPRTRQAKRGRANVVKGSR